MESSRNCSARSPDRMAPILRAPTGLRKFSSMSTEARVTASRRLAAKLLEMSQSTREEPASGQGQRQSDNRIRASFLQDAWLWISLTLSSWAAMGLYTRAAQRPHLLCRAVATLTALASTQAGQAQQSPRPPCPRVHCPAWPWEGRLTYEGLFVGAPLLHVGAWPDSTVAVVHPVHDATTGKEGKGEGTLVTLTDTRKGPRVVAKGAKQVANSAIHITKRDGSGFER